MSASLHRDRDRLVVKHAGYARGVAVKAMTDQALIMEYDDAAQVGLEALCVAAKRFDFDKFDPSLGDIDTHFKAFAYLRIRGAVIDHARKNTFVKRRGIEKGLSYPMVSLDAPISFCTDSEESTTTRHLAAVSGDPDLMLDFEAAIATLTEREKYVVLALAAGAKGRELADELGITESRISQLNAKAKDKIANYMEEM